VSNKAYMYMLADLPSKPSDKASTVCQIWTKTKKAHQRFVKFSNTKIQEDSFRCSELLHMYRQIIVQCDFHRLSVQIPKIGGERWKKGRQNSTMKEKLLTVMPVHNYEITWCPFRGTVTSSHHCEKLQISHPHCFDKMQRSIFFRYPGSYKK
jgi:hypothetical protein